MSSLPQKILNGAWYAAHPKQAFAAYRKSISIQDHRGWDIMLGGASSYTGKTVTDLSLLQLASTWTAIRLISETIGMMPLNMMERTDKGDIPAIKHKTHRVVRVQPNVEQTTIDMQEALGVSLCIYGQAYQLPTKFGSRLTALSFVSKKIVSPRIVNGRVIYTVNFPDKPSKEFMRGDIIPIKGFGGGDSIEGIPVYQAQSNAIALAAACEEYGSRYFSNGARPSGILTIDRILKDDQREVLRERFEDIHKGLENSNKLSLLEAGMQYQQISASASDAQLNETRAYQIQEIARIFRIPLRMMMDPLGDKYNNNEQDNIRFYQNTLHPYLKRIEEAYNTTLLTHAEQLKYYFKFDVSELFRMDSKARSEYQRNQRAIGGMTINDVRVDEGRPKFVGDVYDDPMVPLNMAPPELVREILLPAKEDDSNV